WCRELARQRTDEVRLRGGDDANIASSAAPDTQDCTTVQVDTHRPSGAVIGDRDRRPGADKRKLRSAPGSELTRGGGIHVPSPI
ncbi:MAG: hypothetical protein KAY09_00695, partial [Nitrospira sp.]|nr:hypothetical protein [Nitrospira sp.]